MTYFAGIGLGSTLLPGILWAKTADGAEQKHKMYQEERVVAVVETVALVVVVVVVVDAAVGTAVVAAPVPV